MKSLAAVSIRQLERAVESLEEYRLVIDAGWRALLRLRVGVTLKTRMTDAVCMVIGSDQGMCGQFNEAILKYAMEQAPKFETDGAKVMFWMFGEKLRGALEGAGQRSVNYFGVPGNLSAVTVQVQEVVQRIEAERSLRGIEHVTVCHNAVSERGGYHQVCTRLLPLDKAWAEAYVREKWPNRCLPMMGLPREAMFRHLFRQHLFVSLYRAFAQSMAGENAARLMAMQAAEKNILEVVEGLQADFRDLRQAAITGEILDIISGFEALSDASGAL